MSIQLDRLEAEEPPLSAAEILVGKVSRLLLIGLCGAPIALFPLGVAYKTYAHYFEPQATPIEAVALQRP